MKYFIAIWLLCFCSVAFGQKVTMLTTKDKDSINRRIDSIMRKIDTLQLTGGNGSTNALTLQTKDSNYYLTYNNLHGKPDLSIYAPLSVLNNFLLYGDTATMLFDYMRIADANASFVTKLPGKGLSTHDFKDLDSVKLAGLSNTTITNNLNTTASGTALDAIQGKILKDTSVAIRVDVEAAKRDIGGYQIFTTTLSNNTVSAATTQFTIMGVANFSTESNRSIVMTKAGVITNLYLITNNTQSGGTLTATIRKNGASQLISLVIADGATAGVYSATGSVIFAAGDKISIMLANASASASAQLNCVGFNVKY